MEYGLQMYSVRDFTEKDLLGTLKKVAEIGYKYIEFAGFFGNSAEDVKAAVGSLRAGESSSDLLLTLFCNAEGR